MIIYLLWKTAAKVRNPYGMRDRVIRGASLHGISVRIGLPLVSNRDVRMGPQHEGMKKVKPSDQGRASLNI